MVQCQQFHETQHKTHAIIWLAVVGRGGGGRPRDPSRRHFCHVPTCSGDPIMVFWTFQQICADPAERENRPHFDMGCGCTSCRHVKLGWNLTRDSHPESDPILIWEVDVEPVPHMKLGWNLTCDSHPESHPILI